VWAIANPNTHHALTSERRWTPDQYEQWLAHILACALLTSENARPESWFIPPGSSLSGPPG
jgi:hypothetical protein